MKKDVKRKIRWSALGGVLLLAGGCALVGMMLGEKTLSTFNHKIHSKEGLDCDQCHEGCVEKDVAGLPSIDFCNTCHEEKPSAGYTKWLNSKPQKDKKAQLLPRKIGSYEDVIFSHAKHDKVKVSCAQCHGKIAESTNISDKFIPDMELCVACHKEKKPLDCANCHKTIRKDKKPDSHNEGWKRLHGAEVGAEFELTDNRCYLCHSQSSCKQCHLAEPPESHTANWRTRTHGLYAETERDSCMVCHNQSYCSRCHEAAPPRPRDFTHNAATDCIPCHKAIDHGLRFTESSECTKCHR